MKLYLLRPNPWYASLAKLNIGFVIRADNELRAREIADKENGNAYWPLTWLDETYSTCVELDLLPDGQEEMIISDFTITASRKDFLKLPVEERRKILKKQAQDLADSMADLSMSCPIGLHRWHCHNCYFQRRGKCDHDQITAKVKGGKLCQTQQA